jgi:hypothetical protein
MLTNILRQQDLGILCFHAFHRQRFRYFNGTLQYIPNVCSPHYLELLLTKRVLWYFDIFWF